ncbi:type II secretion system protein [Fervidobacterium sp.]
MSVQTKLRPAYSLVETLVALLLISIVFMIITTGISSVLQSLSSIQNQQKVIELENFLARYIYIQGSVGQTTIDLNAINSGFHKSNGSQISYPKVVNLSSTATSFFVKFVFTIERVPGKTEEFVVYQYKSY